MGEVDSFQEVPEVHPAHPQVELAKEEAQQRPFLTDLKVERTVDFRLEVSVAFAADQLHSRSLQLATWTVRMTTQ